MTKKKEMERKMMRMAASRPLRGQPTNHVVHMKLPATRQAHTPTISSLCQMEEATHWDLRFAMATVGDRVTEGGWLGRSS